MKVIESATPLVANTTSALVRPQPTPKPRVVEVLPGLMLAEAIDEFGRLVSCAEYLDSTDTGRLDAA